MEQWENPLANGIPEPEPEGEAQVSATIRNAPGYGPGRTDRSVFKSARARLLAHRRNAQSSAKLRVNRALSMGQEPGNVESSGRELDIAPPSTPSGFVPAKTDRTPAPPSTKELLASTTKRAVFMENKQRDSDRESDSKESNVPAHTLSESTQSTHKMSQQDMFFASLVKSLDGIKSDISGLGERMGGVERHIEGMDLAITDTASKLRDSTHSNLPQSNTQTDYKQLKEIEKSLKDRLSPSASGNVGNKVGKVEKSPITWDLMDDSRALDDYDPSEYHLPSYKRKLAVVTTAAEISNMESGYRPPNTGYEVSAPSGLSIPLVETNADLPTDRRHNMFYGAPPKAFEFTAQRLPKCFTDGSNIKAKYNHFPSESIEDFVRTIKMQLRPYPVYQWIPLVRK